MRRCPMTSMPRVAPPLVGSGKPRGQQQRRGVRDEQRDEVERTYDNGGRKRQHDRRLMVGTRRFFGPTLA